MKGTTLNRIRCKIKGDEDNQNDCDKKNKSSNQYSIDVGEVIRSLRILERRTLNKSLMIMMLIYQSSRFLIL